MAYIVMAYRYWYQLRPTWPVDTGDSYGLHSYGLQILVLVMPYIIMAYRYWNQLWPTQLWPIDTGISYGLYSYGLLLCKGCALADPCNAAASRPIED